MGRASQPAMSPLRKTTGGWRSRLFVNGDDNGLEWLAAHNGESTTDTDRYRQMLALVACGYAVEFGRRDTSVCYNTGFKITIAGRRRLRKP